MSKRTVIGIGVERGTFHVNRIDFDERGRSTVTRLSSHDNMADAYAAKARAEQGGEG